MNGIEGGGSTHNLSDASKPGLEGALTLSKRRIESRLGSRGLINDQAGMTDEKEIVLETSIISSETSDTDPNEVSQWVAVLRTGMKEEPDQAQDAQSHIQPDRAVSLMK